MIIFALILTAVGSFSLGRLAPREVTPRGDLYQCVSKSSGVVVPCPEGDS